MLSLQAQYRGSRQKCSSPSFSLEGLDCVLYQRLLRIQFLLIISLYLDAAGWDPP